jgi:hypothetical protein
MRRVCYEMKVRTYRAGTGVFPQSCRSISEFTDISLRRAGHVSAESSAFRQMRASGRRYHAPAVGKQNHSPPAVLGKGDVSPRVTQALLRSTRKSAATTRAPYSDTIRTCPRCNTATTRHVEPGWRRNPSLHFSSDERSLDTFNRLLRLGRIPAAIFLAISSD